MSAFGDVQPYLHDYGYLAVAAGLLLENLGLPLPGETVLIAASVLAARGMFDIRLLLPLAWAAATLGNAIGYLIGRYGGHALVARYGAYVGITHERLAWVERHFDRYGAWLLMAARFVVVLRSLSGIVAGTLEMAWGRFLVFNALGAALWVGWWSIMSYWLGHKVFELVHQVKHIEPVLFAVAGIVVVVIVARLTGRRR